MKSLVISSVLFICVIVLISTDYFMLDRLLNDTKKELELIPKNLSELEGLQKKEITEIEKALEKTEKMWKKKETFLGLSLKHNVSREFTGQLIPAISYFKSEEYPEFLALVSSALDTVEHISYDEGLNLGNLF